MEAKVEVMKIDKEAQLPEFKTEGSACADLTSVEEVFIEAGKTVVIRTGLKMAIPEGWEGQIRSRSGMSTHGVFCTNAPGILDSDYRGEVKVVLTNSSSHPAGYLISVGDRIAQLAIRRAPEISFQEVKSLNNTERGEGGLGSTGK